MKNRFILFYLMLIASNIFAQTGNKTKLVGFVSDSIQNPILYATIELFNSDSIFKYGAITDTNGVFYIDSVKAGKYIVKISAIAFKTKYQNTNILANKKTFSLGWIPLKVNTELLSEVVVNAHKTGYTTQVDKSLFYPDSNLVKRSKDALDLIKKVPKVHVNKRNNEIKVLGSSNVLVLINGVNNGRTLKSISPEDIERIEVITNPSVKYNSDVANVLNVVLKDKRTQGLSVYADLALCMHQKNHQAFTQISYNYKKIRVFVNYNGYFSKMLSLDTTIRKEGIYKYTTIPLDKSVYNSGIQALQYGFDFFPNKTFKLNLTGQLNYEKAFGSTNSKTSYLRNDTILTDEISYNNNFNYSNIQQNYSLYLEKKFNKSNTISSTTNLYFLENTINSDYSYLNVINNINSLSTQNSINSKIDYSHKFNNKINLETGYKLYSRNIINKVTDSENVNNSKYFDIRNSGYINSVFKLNNFGVQVGLRTENLEIQIYDTIKNNYTNILPNVSLNQKINHKNNIHLSYNQKLDYPRFYHLNPYTYASPDSVSFSSGNPYLKPEVSHNINLEYIYNSNNFYSAISLKYKNVDNIIIEQLYTQNGIISSKYFNKGKAQIYTGDLETSFSLFDLFDIDLSINGAYSMFKDNAEHNGFSYYFELQFYSQLPWDIDLDIDIIFFEKTITYNGYESTNLSIDEISLSKDISDDFTVGFSVWEPFFKAIDKERLWTNTYSENTISQITNNTCYMFNLTYNLNKGKKAKKIKHESLMEYNSKGK